MGPTIRGCKFSDSPYSIASEDSNKVEKGVGEGEDEKLNDNEQNVEIVVGNGMLWASYEFRLCSRNHKALRIIGIRIRFRPQSRDI